MNRPWGAPKNPLHEQHDSHRPHHRKRPKPGRSTRCGCASRTAQRPGRGDPGASGWRIYDAAPFFPFSIPTVVTLGGWLGGALQWHFAAMWLLVANGLFYLFMNIATGRLAAKFFPLTPAGVWRDALPP
ncbi:putative protein-methionine-sulfoxide reductase subunit YedZ1 [Ditylenchus destructor]|uniref:Uncharacterized protein n=1 Tax=Ditylenchus destructor TaxID=166010 RepID=A0AAD4MFH4_9BILA|nr:putative protein-methionine-sulfoxide reductase subunit YedZ1 [Ditylenchus destructor]